MFKYFKNQKYFSLARYCFVGLNGTILDIGALAILVEFFHINLGIATAISFILAVIHNFIFNKWWTFKNTSSYVFHQYIKFLIVSLVGFLLTMCFMYTLTIYFGLWYIFSKIITSALVLVWNFIANYNWTFKENIVIPYNTETLYEYSIIIPAYNESKRIKKTLQGIVDYFSSKKELVEIIIVDDGSKDQTSRDVDIFLDKEICAKNIQNIKYCCIKLDKNYGKGRAVRTGILKSRGKYVLYMDADGSAPIYELENLMKYINNNEIVIGSRKNNQNIKISQPAYRKVIGMFRRLSTIFIIKNVIDTQCGFKLMKSEIAYDIFNRITINRFGFDIELLVLAEVKGCRVTEVPIEWSHVGESHVRVVKDTFLSLEDLFFIYFNSLTGRYK